MEKFVRFLPFGAWRRVCRAAAVAAAAVAAAACSSSDSAEPLPKSTLSVMSFNVRMTTDADTGDRSWEARREPCVKMIREVHPDVIGMQEPRPEQREYLSASLPEYAQLWIAADETRPENQCGHLSLFYLAEKFELADWGYYWLSATPGEPSMPWNTTDNNYRTTLWARLRERASQREFFIFTTHLPYKAENDEPRLRCSQLNVRMMKQIAGQHAPLFLTGDMNCSHAAEDKRRGALEPLYEWMRSGRDTAPATDAKYSFNAFSEKAKSTWNYDHIFYRNVEPLRFRTVTDSGYGVRFLSDHYPIVLTVEW